ASRGTSAASPALHPLQQAWIDVQVPHCGYCQNGMMIQAADLLSSTKNPTEDQIRTAMNGHLCRCGTYPRILTAIKQAAAVMAKGGPPLRAAAATARQALLGMASTSLGVPVSSLTVKDGVVSGGGKTVKYSDLIAGKSFNISIPGQPTSSGATAFAPGTP